MPPPGRLALLPLLLALATAARAEDAGVCAEAIAARGGDPLAALAEAEQERWREAKRLEREARKLAKQALGRGQAGAAVGLAGDVDDAIERRLAVLREARALCRCRAARGDPLRADCDALYAEWLPR